MRARGRLVLGGAVVFAVAIGALESGGWWWAWLAAATAVVIARGVRLPFIGVRLNPTSRYILAENRRTRRNNRELTRRKRRAHRQQRRVARRQKR